jgi:hypothetical protein
MSRDSTRARVGSGMMLVAAAALSILALPGVAAGHGHHHHSQPPPTGTIQSFDAESGELVIDLSEGGTVSGLVFDRTWIKCGDDHGWHHGWRHGRRHRRHRHRHGGRASASHHDGGAVHGEHWGHGPEGAQDTPGHDGTPPGASEGPGQGAEHSARCTTDELTPGAPVEFAALVLVNGNAYYKLVVLSKPEEEPEGEGQP